jgi:acyl-CoA synthetase (AMP-forming)/AMP-acid ligase II
MQWATDLYGAIHDVALGASWSGQRLRTEIERRAGRLIELGVCPGALVAIVHGGSAPFIADLFAVWACGATAVPLDPALTPIEMNHLIRFIKPRLALSAKHDTDPVPGVITCCLDGSDARFTGVRRSEVSPHALVLVTSGTTGAPKAVVLGHQALHNRLRLNVEAIGKAPLARALVTLPTSFGHGLIGNVLTPLFAGGDVIFPARGAAMPSELGRLIDEHDITFLTAVPALWRMALKLSNEPSNKSLIRVHAGSSALPENLWRDIDTWSGAETVNCYGLTEVANWFSGASSRSVSPRNGLVGHPWGGRAAILHPSGEIVARGEGELLIQSPSMMEAYLMRPDLTEECQTAGWYRTGDFGLIEDDGQIVLQGRLKDEINRGGAKIQPAELDMLLETNPAVEEACAFPIPDPIVGETIGVAVCLKPGATATAEALKSWCRERMRRASIPERWYFVAELPRSPRGKTRREEVYRLVTGTGQQA